MLTALNILVLTIGILNYNSTGGQLILSGFAMNVTCYFSNGYMPVYNNNVDINWWNEHNDGLHRLNPPNANFSFFGDWWVMPNATISPGDILMFFGVCTEVVDYFR